MIVGGGSSCDLGWSDDREEDEWEMRRRSSLIFICVNGMRKDALKRTIPYGETLE